MSKEFTHHSSIKTSYVIQIFTDVLVLINECNFSLINNITRILKSCKFVVCLERYNCHFDVMDNGITNE